MSRRIHCPSQLCWSWCIQLDADPELLPYVDGLAAKVLQTGISGQCQLTYPALLE
jgi:hypothetical protein